MKLQLSLDLTSILEAKNILGEVSEYVDIIEIGTPFIIKEGLKAVEKIKLEYPNLVLLADLKIIDAGEYEAQVAFDAGADIVTVLGVSDDNVIKRVVSAAKRSRKLVMVDMISVKNLIERTNEINEFGVDYICVHRATDANRDSICPLTALQQLKSAIKGSKTAVAGGITLDILPEVVKEKPDIIVIGGGITNQLNMKETVMAIKTIMSCQGEA